jgi:hypothetical protein
MKSVRRFQLDAESGGVSHRWIPEGLETLWTADLEIGAAVSGA